MSTKQRRAKQPATGYIVRSLPIMDVERTPVEMSYQDNDDGTVTAMFDVIPGAFVTGDTIGQCVDFMSQVAKIIQGKLAEDIRAMSARPDGRHSGQLSLADLEQRGIQTRLVDGYYCTRVLGTPNVMFMCRDVDALGLLVGLLLQLAMVGYRHDRKAMH